jgi:23S rRNA pseudouridine2605 synthase
MRKNSSGSNRPHEDKKNERGTERKTASNSYRPKSTSNNGGFGDKKIDDKRIFDKNPKKTEGRSVRFSNDSKSTDSKFERRTDSREFDKSKSFNKKFDKEFTPKRGLDSDFKSNKPTERTKNDTNRDFSASKFEKDKYPKRTFEGNRTESSNSNRDYSANKFEKDKYPKKSFEANRRDKATSNKEVPSNKFEKDKYPKNSFDRNGSFKSEFKEKRTRTHEKPERDHPRPQFENRNSDQTPPRFLDRKKGYEGRGEDRKHIKSRSDFDKPKTEIDPKQAGLKRRPNYEEDKLVKQLPPKVQKKVDTFKPKSETIRLNRYIANAGLCSRREADEFIGSGQITVNGKVITEMGYQVKGSDVVKYGRKILNREKLVYVLLNKPKDFLTTTDDPEGRKTVMDLVAKACEERIYPVGRLDRATTGLLLLTNDGELADKLSHPSNNIKKIYQAELNKPLTQEHFDQILEGLELEDGKVKADDLAVITPDTEVIGIEIHSGKNRIVRRIFEHLGYEVLKLDRTTYAGLTKKDLPRGNWRFLTEKEVIRLKYLM